MSLQTHLLMSHAFGSHALTTVTVYRCCLCSAASTQCDIMREHAAMYHGLCGDGNVFANFTTEILSATPEKDSGAYRAGLVGSKKRKSTVPERVRCHTVFLDEEPPTASAQTATATAIKPSMEDALPKQKKPRTSTAAAAAGLQAGGGGEGKSSPRKPLTTVAAVAVAVEQILLPCDASDSCEVAWGAQPESALDLSMKGTAVPHQPHLQGQPPARHSQHALQREQQQVSAVSAPVSPSLTQQQQQRQNFTSSQNARLLLWFTEHRSRPYPSTEETKSLAQATGLNYSQVKKWFANKRMRSKAAAAGGGEAESQAGSPRPRDGDEDEAQSHCWVSASSAVRANDLMPSPDGSSPTSAGDFDRSY